MSDDLFEGCAKRGGICDCGDRPCMVDKQEGIVQRANELFTEEVLKEQDGSEVPLRLGLGGPVIGHATMKYDPEKKALMADFEVTDPEVADALLRNRPRYF